MNNPEMDHDLNYLKADMHRAMEQGARSISVRIDELSRLLAAVESSNARAAQEFRGKPLGFVKAHKARAVMAGEKVYITLSRSRHADFDMPVLFTEIPEAP